MIAIELIPAVNNRPASRAIPDRECSFKWTRGGQSVILHSASLRSTGVYSADSTQGVVRKRPWKENREVWHALRYWLAQDQRAVDAIIENLLRDRPLDEAESAACIASRPDWSFQRIAYQHAGGDILATRASGRAVERQVANSWRWIHARTA